MYAAAPAETVTATGGGKNLQAEGIYVGGKGTSPSVHLKVADVCFIDGSCSVKFRSRLPVTTS
jgi:hypothetical protein